MSVASVAVILLLAGWGSGQEASWSGFTCRAPRAPDNGLSFIFEEGREVRFACHPGYLLVGNAVSLCRKEDARWDHPVPECLPDKAVPTEPGDTTLPQGDSNPVPPRPLFSWDNPEVTPVVLQGGPEELKESRRLPLINGQHGTAKVNATNKGNHTRKQQPGQQAVVTPDDWRQELDMAEVRRRQQLEASRVNSVLTFPRVDNRQRPDRTDVGGRQDTAEAEQRRWRIAQARKTPNILYAGSRSASAYRGDTGDIIELENAESVSSDVRWEPSQLPDPVPQRRLPVSNTELIELRQRQIAETLRNRMASIFPRGSNSDKAGLIEDARKRQYEELQNLRSSIRRPAQWDDRGSVVNQNDQQSSHSDSNRESSSEDAAREATFLSSYSDGRDLSEQSDITGHYGEVRTREFMGEVQPIGYDWKTSDSQDVVSEKGLESDLELAAEESSDNSVVQNELKNDFRETRVTGNDQEIDNNHRFESISGPSDVDNVDIRTRNHPEMADGDIHWQEAVSNRETVIHPDVLVEDNFHDDRIFPGPEERIEIDIFRPTDDARVSSEIIPELDIHSIAPSRGDPGQMDSQYSANFQSGNPQHRRAQHDNTHYSRPDLRGNRAVFSAEKAAQVEATIRRFLQPGGLLYTPPTIPTYFARRVSTTVPTYYPQLVPRNTPRPTYTPRPAPTLAPRPVAFPTRYPTRPNLPPPVRSPVHEANNEKAGYTEETMYQQYLQAEHLRRIMEYERDRLDWERQREWERRNIVQAEEHRRAAQTSADEDESSEELRQRPEEEVQGPEEVLEADLEYANRLAVLSSVDRQWLEQLSPDLQARYLEEILTSRGKESGETKHAEEFLRRYMGTQNATFPSVSTRTSASGHVTTIIQSHASQNRTGSGMSARWDLSCLQSRSGRRLFIRAPKVPFGYVYRYERKRQPPQHKPYLVAEYRCRRGFKMADPNNDALYCRRMDWVGEKPTCVKRT